MTNSDITPEQILPGDVDRLCARLDEQARAGGYNLNPDLDVTRDLVCSLLVNQARYGYWACPCRLAADDKHEDLDIICPCDYRDEDLTDYGACYCALYVSDEVVRGGKAAESIPERRPRNRQSRAQFRGASEIQAVGADQQPGKGGADQQPAGADADQQDPASGAPGSAPARDLPYPVWRCRVCGYLCARPAPPGVCPVCKAHKERFERFI